MRLVFVRESDLDLMGGVVTSPIFSDLRPMSEDEFLALGETSERIELFDGSLHVTPAPTPRHQYIAGELKVIFRAAGRARGLYALEGINLRLGPNQMTIPDLAITSAIDFDQITVPSSAVRLVCEILSPSNQASDKVLKMHYYAAAGIPWYLLVDPKAETLSLYELAGETYALHSITEVGEVLRLTDPVAVDLEPSALMPD